MLLAEDPNYKKGFRFDHVWPILKGIEKFTDDNITIPLHPRQSDTLASSQSDSPTSDSPKSPNLSSFSLNLSEEDVGGTSTERPIGVKKKQNQKEKRTVIV